MNAPTLYGQCFLCQRDLWLTHVHDARLTRHPDGYLCPQCGGISSAERIESNTDIHGNVSDEVVERNAEVSK